MNNEEKDPVRAERLNEVYRYLFSQKLIKGKSDFAAKIESQRTAVSAAFSGKKAYLTNNLFMKIVAKFPNIFNLDYLLDGKGMLLMESTEQVAPIDQQADALMFAVDQIGKMAVKATEALARIEAYEARLTAALERVESYEAKMQQMMSTNFIIATPSSRKTHASTTPDVEKIIAGARMLYQKEKKPRKQKITIAIQNSTHDVAAEDVPK